ncbi:hypothetical protein ES703_117720 [subsurface metagenome]
MRIEVSDCKLILKISNPYDLKHIQESDESITKSYTDMISSLAVGELLIVGNAVNYPAFIEVRQRICDPTKSRSLLEMCSHWWNIHEKERN